METSHLRLNAPRSFTVYNDQLWLYFSQLLSEKISLMRARQDLIYEYNRTSLVVILFLRYSSTTAGFGFLPGPLG